MAEASAAITWKDGINISKNSMLRRVLMACLSLEWIR
jgi:hypothetical protein